MEIPDTEQLAIYNIFSKHGTINIILCIILEYVNDL